MITLDVLHCLRLAVFLLALPLVPSLYIKLGPPKATNAWGDPLCNWGHKDWSTANKGAAKRR
jgi:hypothetical protein